MPTCLKPFVGSKKASFWGEERKLNYQRMKQLSEHMVLGFANISRPIYYFIIIVLERCVKPLGKSLSGAGEWKASRIAATDQSKHSCHLSTLKGTAQYVRNGFFPLNKERALFFVWETYFDASKNNLLFWFWFCSFPLAIVFCLHLNQYLGGMFFSVCTSMFQGRRHGWRRCSLRKGLFSSSQEKHVVKILLTH